MKIRLLCCAAGVAFSTIAHGATAFEALRAIHGANLSQLALIDGHEGSPEPDRWHFLFYAPESSTGLRECVVENGQVVADREVSQFAESLTANDAIEPGELTVDSDRIYHTALRFAEANKLPISSINYAMRKDARDGSPIWTVVCRDEQDHPYASLVITGSDGLVVSHEGFAIDPAQLEAQRIAKAAAAVEKLKSRKIAQVHREIRVSELPPIYDGPDDSQIEVRRAEPVRRPGLHLPNPVEDVQRLHRFVRGLLPF